MTLPRQYKLNDLKGKAQAFAVEVPSPPRG